MIHQGLYDDQYDYNSDCKDLTGLIERLMPAYDANPSGLYDDQYDYNSDCKDPQGKGNALALL